MVEVCLQNEGSSLRAVGNTRVTIENNTAGKLEVECPQLLVRVCWWKAERRLYSENIATSFVGGGVHLQRRVKPQGEWEQHTRDDREQHSRTSWRWSVLSWWCGCVGGKRSGACDSEEHSHKLSWWRCAPAKRGVKPQGEWEQHTRDDREQHSRTIWRWSVLIAGAGVLVESGAALVIQKNIATSFDGGGVYLHDEGQASGQWEQHTLTIENNTAGKLEVECPQLVVSVLVESGAALVIQKNIATSFVVEVCTCKTRVKPQGSGNSTRVTIENNTAGQAGGGVSSFGGAGVLVERSGACDSKNIATSLDGGGVYLQGGGQASGRVGTAHA